MHQKDRRMARGDALSAVDQGVDQPFADLAEIAGFPVIASTGRLTGIQHGLVLHEWLQCNRVSKRPAECLKREYGFSSAGGITAPAQGDRRDRFAVHCLGQISCRRSATEDQQAAELVWRSGCDFPVLMDNVPRFCHRMHNQAAPNSRTMSVRPEFERRYDAKVATTTAQGPEQIGVFRFARPTKSAVGGDNVDRNQVIRRVSELARGPAEAPTQGEACHTRIRYDPARNDQTERLSLVVNVAPRRAGFSMNNHSAGIDAHRAAQ